MRQWLWKFIFGAANLDLAEDGEVVIAIEIAAEISQLINFLTAVSCHGSEWHFLVTWSATAIG